MKRRHYLSAMVAVALAVFLSACGGSTTSTTVTLSPLQATVILGGTQQFTAAVSGPSDRTVSWSVSGTGCSGTQCGTIDANGLYTAPSAMINPASLTVTATSNANTKATATATVTIDSGVRVQISPTDATLASGDQFDFTATVTGTTTTGVTWNVNGTPNGDAASGLVCVAGISPCQTPSGPVNTITYEAPSGLLGTVQVTLTAVSVDDTTQQSSVKLTVMPAVAPVIASITPPATAQGAVRQQVYINAESPSNFFSTSTVLANGQPVPTTFISTSLLRAQVPAARLQSGQTVEIAVESQGGTAVSNSIGLTVAPVRPSIVSFSPVSVPQCPATGCGPSSVTLDGGYFSPSTAVSFNGQATGATLNSSNQMAVSLPGNTLETAGLYQLTLTNPGAAQPEAAVNVAVEPSPANNPPSVVTTAPVQSQPSAVAVDPMTGMAVVVNTGSDSISLVSLPSCSGGGCAAPTNIPVGAHPTGVAVDPLKNIAIVVNQGSNTLSLVNLASFNVQTVDLPSGYTPVSIGENPLTGHALVANQETNTETVVDLSKSPAVTTTVDVTQGGTRPGGTGLNPRVIVEPRLDWAIVTPGGSGAISAIDMSHMVIDPTTAQPTFGVVFSFTLSTAVAGVSLNPITDDLLLTDPDASTATIFSLLNESVRNITNSANNNVVGYDLVASGVNPLTDVGLVVSEQTSTVQLIDMRDAQVIGSPLTVGGSPVDVALDTVADEAVVVNQADGTVSVVSLGTVRPLAVLQASVSSLPASSGAHEVTLIGGGFDSSAAVRIDGAALSSPDVAWKSSREIDATVPASYLSGPRILNIDVENPGSVLSNIYQIPVIQSVPVGTAPVGVAIDPASNTAVVTNSGSATASLIDLSAGAVSATVNVGSEPLGVAILSRTGQAVVANSGDDTASIIDLCTAASANSSSSCVPSATSFPVSAATSTVQQPVAVDVDPDTGVAAIANEQSDRLSFMDVQLGTIKSELAVDLGPIGVAIDPNIGYLAALCGTQVPPAVDIAQFQAGSTNSTAYLTGHITGATLPSGVALDPVNDEFLVADSTGNRILIIDPQSNKITQNIGTGINPTSIAYNLNALEAVTVNQLSHTASIVEITPSGSQVRSLIPVDGSSQNSVAINPLTNLAVVADQSHNRVLLVPVGH